MLWTTQTILTSRETKEEVGWDKNPLPPNQSLKPSFPQESQEEKHLQEGHSTRQTHWEKNQETLGYSFDTKKSGNSFCLKRLSKDSHFVQKDFPVMCVCFFLPRHSLSPRRGKLQVLFKTFLWPVQVAVLRSPGTGSDGWVGLAGLAKVSGLCCIYSVLICFPTALDSCGWDMRLGRQTWGTDIMDTAHCDSGRVVGRSHSMWHHVLDALFPQNRWG